ncbi:hypothetical protein DUNSADRAFT_1770 [Dunaliella salina]|uniref:Large ribosomal subunit protein bL21m n=1 Tax=Dunaliella salina TaxID=3046 RepID=A0ABQ7FX20_DUNSA|nr:hypothetical protein DUNSADRAFT_1770 [Dunaliella salina]|eukprot:KAF5826910.1 hypothetical protein DUNSADRAFT_1770 [Dunaliella salina]
MSIVAMKTIQKELAHEALQLNGGQDYIDIHFMQNLDGYHFQASIALGWQEHPVQGSIRSAFVEAAVEEHFLDGKVHVFKFKRRNRYRKYAAPRPHLTTLRILSIHGLPETSAVAPGAQSSAGSPNLESGALQQLEQGGEQVHAAQQALGHRPRLPIKYYSEAVAL